MIGRVSTIAAWHTETALRVLRATSPWVVLVPVAGALGIYLLHTFILFPFRETPVLHGRQPFWVLPAMILFCIGISVVLSLRPVRRVFRPLVEPRARWLFRAEPATATGTLVLPPGAMPPLPGETQEPSTTSSPPAASPPAPPAPPEDPPSTGARPPA